ncbi:DUF2909 domain-containing protein [Vibrio aquaticus]|uniref:DUF2909 domain-containing protein n=1 Tax=Vibrio aquaticus TaxID=2496559 RepID=A0A3S0MR36_9VIBR|nr:DUF2909 family protein [Vibrio aquaticus]RTZ18053.1 DUF2909 domain-containing protein [Vibrio aquaticus]
MVFIFKLLLVLLLLFILFNLGRAMIEMVKGPNSDDDDQETSEDEKPMSFYLGRRVFLSALAVVLMVAALLSGFIEPNIRPY